MAHRFTDEELENAGRFLAEMRAHPEAWRARLRQALEPLAQAMGVRLGWEDDDDGDGEQFH